MPTGDEVLCAVPPYLPKGPSMHLPAGSAEALLDRWFRCEFFSRCSTPAVH